MKNEPTIPADGRKDPQFSSLDQTLCGLLRERVLDSPCQPGQVASSTPPSNSVDRSITGSQKLHHM